MPPTQNDPHEIVIERIFDTPRKQAWEAWTLPHHIEKWFGPKGFGTRVEALDFQEGGEWRYVMIGPDGTEYPSVGVFIEIIPEEKIVTTDDFGEEMKKNSHMDLPKGLVTSVFFEDLGSKTNFTIRMTHPTEEEKIKHEKMGAREGFQSMLDCLEEYLEIMQKERKLILK
ncbi:MAG: SRPBCC domain-containing protein [Candidatus Peregrinibacteria bacterium]